MNGKNGKFIKTVFFFQELTQSTQQKKKWGRNPQTMVKGWVSSKNKFTSREALFDKLKDVLKQLY